MGAIYYQLGNYEQCIAFNDRCILLDPSLAESHANLANALQQIGNYDMAIVYYQVPGYLIAPYIVCPKSARHLLRDRRRDRELSGTRHKRCALYIMRCARCVRALLAHDIRTLIRGIMVSDQGVDGGSKSRKSLLVSNGLCEPCFIT